MNADAPTVEIIDSGELAKRWKVPESWIRSYTRERTPREQRIHAFALDVTSDLNGSRLP